MKFFLYQNFCSLSYQNGGDHFRIFTHNALQAQWRNGAQGAPATPRGDDLGGRQIVIKTWDNLARLTGRLAKVRV